MHFYCTEALANINHFGFVQQRLPFQSVGLAARFPLRRNSFLRFSDSPLHPRSWPASGLLGYYKLQIMFKWFSFPCCQTITITSVDKLFFSFLRKHKSRCQVCQMSCKTNGVTWFHNLVTSNKPCSPFQFILVPPAGRCLLGSGATRGIHHVAQKWPKLA